MMATQENKNMFRYWRNVFLTEWRHVKHKKQVIYHMREAVKQMRMHKLTIAALYKEIPFPLRVNKLVFAEKYEPDNIFKPMFLTYKSCLTCYASLDDDFKEDMFNCPYCGQALWLTDPLGDNVDRYEGYNIDGVHRRLKEVDKNGK